MARAGARPQAHTGGRHLAVADPALVDVHVEYADMRGSAVRDAAVAMRPEKGACSCVSSRTDVRLWLGTIAAWPSQATNGTNRGRDARCRTPPAQIPASPIRALGSYLGCVTAKRTSGQG
jgi:hypothetical protein